MKPSGFGPVWESALASDLASLAKARRRSGTILGRAGEPSRPTPPLLALRPGRLTCSPSAGRSSGASKNAGSGAAISRILETYAERLAQQTRKAHTKIRGDNLPAAKPGCC